MSQHTVAAVERARIAVAAKLTGRTFDDESARQTAQAITDALEADHWRAPGTPDSQPQPYRHEQAQAADPDHAQAIADAIRTDMTEIRRRRQHAEAQAEAARQGSTDG